MNLLQCDSPSEIFKTKYDSLCLAILASSDIFGDARSRISLFVIFADHEIFNSHLLPLPPW